MIPASKCNHVHSSESQLVSLSSIFENLDKFESILITPQTEQYRILCS